MLCIHDALQAGFCYRTRMLVPMKVRRLCPQQVHCCRVELACRCLSGSVH